MMQLRTLSLFCLLSCGTSATPCESDTCPTAQAAVGASLIQTSGTRSVGTAQLAKNEPDSEAGATPEANTPDSGAGATPVANAPDSGAGATPVVNEPDSGAGATPVTNEPDSGAGATPAANAPDSGALQALQEQVAQLVEQAAAQKNEIAALTDDLSDARVEIAATQKDLQEADDQIWKLTPKELLPKEGLGALHILECKSSGQEACPKQWQGYCINMTDAECARDCKSVPRHCQPGGWYADACTCVTDSSADKSALAACEGKRDHDECEFDVLDRTVTPTSSGGNKTVTTGFGFKSVCAKGKCAPYKDLSCSSVSQGTVSWQPAGTRCVHTKYTDSMSSGWCRIAGQHSDRTKFCSSTYKVRTYMLSKCVDKDGEPNKTTCEPGYNPDYDWQQDQEA